MLGENERGFLKTGCLILIWIFVSIQSLAQPEPVYSSLRRQTADLPPAKVYQNDLFSSDEVLRFKLLVNYKALLKDRGDDRAYHKAAIKYQTANGDTVTVNLKVRVRGKHRRDPTICTFPPLRLNFPKKDVMHTAFAGSDKLKLVTHCIGEKYVLREYLVYKLYNIITDQSFRVRLCYIEYESIEGNKKTESNYAFLIEEDEALARRSKADIIPEGPLIRMDATDNRTMAKLALFQYMIGNTDWSIPYRHNILLLFNPLSGKPIPVPYDFDYTGIVMPPYAKPPPEIGITSVRHRIFRGYTYPDEVVEELVPFFNNRKKAFYQVYAHQLIDEKYRKQTLKYLDDFYETINQRKDFERNIIKMGEQNERKNVIVKGLEK